MLIVLMSLSLIGIIFVQVYFINNSLQNEKNQFTLNAKRSLSFVSDAIEDKEFKRFSEKMYRLIASGAVADSTAFSELRIITEDPSQNQTIIYRNGILEESYKVPSLFLDIGLDSVSISRTSSQRETTIYNRNPIEGNLNIPSEKKVFEFSKLSELDKKRFETTYRDQFKNYPIYKRVSIEDVENMLKRQLHDDGIDTEFEFAIYDKDLATKVQSNNFEMIKGSTYGVPLFLDNNNESTYRLYVNFPDRNKFLFRNILGMTILSIVFTSIIIFAFGSAIHQLIQQRQISQIKSDFINNMTHEFKTPIATINLALDSIKNPKIINDQEKVMRYLNMIKDENKRMHAQVENVLRISKLEKNELNISKERVKLHDLIHDAITHVELIVEDRQGYIKTHLDAEKSSVLANETHFTNVIVNILDNAIKYSDNAPKIDVFTELVGTNILLKISDQGNGMSKQVQKKVFEKFYREHTGNVHNIKGHGLGLAYVKRIVEDHQGHISVESEKGKGSTFTIKLPLIS
ncbi:HAMP domain-containing histidine kinase [Subsaxibacter sp. CAU 1640]|uniref:sensor histidine kinase n=1 Tax=Subsaxibacter sp. CAU 1640 TaxID=2933271 RepID=UPI002004F0AF|nr:HAMP domain-containing sensor histidine kinase [Subsaxibacter sp. CAU 1640]MCK7590827.1 HAMP domain-containing histidine kinase [Subsaxibacter sp. CAU 1640]